MVACASSKVIHTESFSGHLALLFYWQTVSFIYYRPCTLNAIVTLLQGKTWGWDVSSWQCLVKSQLYLSRSLSSERSNIGNTAILPVVRTVSRSHQSFPSFFSPVSLSSSRRGQKTTSVRPPSSCIMSTCAFVYSKESTRTTGVTPQLSAILTHNGHTHIWKETHAETHLCLENAHTHAEKVYLVFCSCCAQNELTAASVGSCTQYRLPYKKIVEYHCLSKVMQRGRDVAPSLSCRAYVQLSALF